MTCTKSSSSSIPARDADAGARSPRGGRSIRRRRTRSPISSPTGRAARDLLIEHLHLIQDAYKQISAAHLAALADEMRLSFAEVFETATFYAHFDVVKEGEPALPPLTIRVCDSISCMLAGRGSPARRTESAGRARRARRSRALRRAVRQRARRGGRP